ncbi:hypothetical protein ACQP1P_09560 [Dactylosporangium sp. CA-052675]|uniref:hypothetical protein n=1 Tax=Dactylosporangium sp. CA-052675 TaxID=3239927 RepID=UPI003D8F593F
MLATMLAAAVIAGVYVLLIARHLHKAAAPGRPHRRLAGAERAAAARLLNGDLDRAGYRAELEMLAALDAAERPLVVPAAER